MLDDREHEKIVKKAEKLQSKAGPEREVLWKRTKAAAGKKSPSSEGNCPGVSSIKEFSKDDLQQAKEMVDKRDKVTDSLQHQLSGFPEAPG